MHIPETLNCSRDEQLSKNAILLFFCFFFSVWELALPRFGSGPFRLGVGPANSTPGEGRANPNPKKGRVMIVITNIIFNYNCNFNYIFAKFRIIITIKEISEGEGSKSGVGPLGWEVSLPFRGGCWPFWEWVVGLRSGSGELAFLLEAVLRLSSRSNGKHKYHVRLARQWRNDRMLLTLPFSKHSSPSLGEADTCALTQRISQYHSDRQTKKNGQRHTYGRTDVHQDTQTDASWDRKEARWTRQKQRQEAEDNRRESRDKTGDKDGGAVWCTLRRFGGFLCGGRVVLLCVGGGVRGCGVVVRVACLCLSCWGLLSGGRLPSPPLTWRFCPLLP